MPEYDFLQIDAFAARPLAGNPCAVVLDADGLPSATMQAIALEMNLSETAFVLRSEVADFGARYFTPAEEIPLAGHPTIATTWALIERGRLQLGQDLVTVTLELRDGPVTVEIDPRVPASPRIWMTQRRPEFLASHDPALVMPAFGLTVEDVLPGAVIQTVSTGTPQLMVPLRDADALRRATLDIRTYEALKAGGDFFSPHLFCTVGFTDAGRTSARHFGTPPDTLEDPYTGSATGAMAAYLWHHHLLEKPTFIAEQGHWMGRPGTGWVEVVGTRDDIVTVKVGGHAVTVLEGTLRL